MKTRLRSEVGWIGASLALVISLGCAESESPPFRLDMTQVVAKQISPEHQQGIADTLDALFGTPDEPFVLPQMGLDLRKLKMAAGPVWNDSRGGKSGLYRLHCAHCHGINGDGQGPTALILNPYPRDYRPGIYKFKSTFTSAEPTDADLTAILHNGVPGTAMPSFALLPPDEIAALVEYVKYLSIRGQVETAIINYVGDEFDPEDSFDPTTDEELRSIIVDELLVDVVGLWQEAPDQVIHPGEGPVPPPDRSAEAIAQSVAAGRELFYGTRANCIQCHGPTALGDGQQTDYDNWSKAKVQFIDDTTALAEQIKSAKEQLRELDGDAYDEAKTELERMNTELQERDDLVAHMLPPRNAIPRNLRDGIYRGGRRPLDLYWRISAGIAGTPMPAGGPSAPGAQGTLTEEEIWQIIDYVQSLPYEPASTPQDSPINFDAVN